MIRMIMHYTLQGFVWHGGECQSRIFRGIRRTSTSRISDCTLQLLLPCCFPADALVCK